VNPQFFAEEESFAEPSFVSSFLRNFDWSKELREVVKQFMCPERLKEY